MLRGHRVGRDLDRDPIDVGRAGLLAVGDREALRVAPAHRPPELVEALPPAASMNARIT